MIELQRALRDIIDFGAAPNPAMGIIIYDYAKYHAVMVIISGLLFLLFAFLSFKFLDKLKNLRKLNQKKWNFESKSYFYFFSITFLLGMLMLLLAVANTTNTLNPLHGLSLAYNASQANGEIYKELNNDEIHQTFSHWIKSGDSSIPTAILNAIKNRVKFHSTKALSSFALLITFVILGIGKWKKLLQNAGKIDFGISVSKRGLNKTIDFCVANVAIAVSLLMMVVVMANIQGAMAPLTAFLVGFF